jgi:hypothetical protein
MQPIVAIRGVARRTLSSPSTSSLLVGCVNHQRHQVSHHRRPLASWSFGNARATTTNVVPPSTPTVVSNSSRNYASPAPTKAVASSPSSSVSVEDRQLNFDDVTESFAVKSTYEVIRALAVFKACSYPWFLYSL